MAIILKNYQQKNVKQDIIPKKDPMNRLMELLNRDIKLFGSSFGDKKKERFYSELNILLSSGVDIRSSLEMLEEEQSRKEDKELMTLIKRNMTEGKNLSEACLASGRFSDYEFYSMKIGEESGRMTEVLVSLAKYYADKIEQRRQIINALSYPSIVITASIGMIIFMMKFVVPMFAELFRQFKGELPAITRLMMKMSNGLSDYGGVSLLFFLCVTFGLYSQRKRIWYRRVASELILRTPIVGSMVRKVYLARFCQSMSLLLSAHTPLNAAINLVCKMVEFYPIEVSLAVVNEEITKGARLNVSLAKFPIYEKRMTSLLKVAEEVKQMDKMFGVLAKQYNDEVDHQTKLLGNIIQPILLLVLGIVVGFIVLAMYMPLFQLSNIMQ